MVFGLLTAPLVPACGPTHCPVGSVPWEVAQDMHGEHRPWPLLLLAWKLQELSTTPSQAGCTHALVQEKSMPTLRICNCSWPLSVCRGRALLCGPIHPCICARPAKGKEVLTQECRDGRRKVLGKSKGNVDPGPHGNIFPFFL